MAAEINKEFAASVVKRLTFLDCDYIEGMSDTAVAEMVLNTGQGRFYILQWLFTRYDSKLASLLQSTHDGSSSRSDSVLHKLALAASAMCLCRPDDIQLIKGEGPIGKQMRFIDKLLELVCTREKRIVPETSFVEPPVSRQDSYLDALVGQEDFPYLLEDKIDLLPRDIRTEVERQWHLSGWDRESSRAPPLPKLQDLAAKAENLSVELEKHNIILSRLKEEITLQGTDRLGEASSLNHVLCRSMRELSQLSQGFSQCYQAIIGQWCHRPPPQLSQLGPAFHRVHTQLSTFTKLLEDLKAVRLHFDELSKRSKLKPQQSQDKDCSTMSATENFESCLSVLEEALHRSGTEFVSRQPLLNV